MSASPVAQPTKSPKPAVVTKPVAMHPVAAQPITAQGGMAPMATGINPMMMQQMQPQPAFLQSK